MDRPHARARIEMYADSLKFPETIKTALTRGRELKSAIRLTNSLHSPTALTRGRELKCAYALTVFI